MNAPPYVITMSFPVKASDVGHYIGKSGNHMKHVKRATGADLIIPDETTSMYNTEWKTIYVCGPSVESVEKALKLLSLKQMKINDIRLSKDAAKRLGCEMCVNKPQYLYDIVIEGLGAGIPESRMVELVGCVPDNQN